MPHNPFSKFRITGTWEDHASYSQGGTDLPVPYGTVIPAPASGTLRISGGADEWACGAVGSAGRRSILTLDKPLARLSPRRASPSEGNGPLVAIVFQHQAAFGAAGWIREGAPAGVSGASVVDGNGHLLDLGGDVHLHWHGLNAQGQRLRLESFLHGSSTAGITAIDDSLEEDSMLLIFNSSWKWLVVAPGFVSCFTNESIVNQLRQKNPDVRIYDVDNGNINAWLRAFSGISEEQIGTLKQNGLWVSPQVGNFPVDYGTSTPSVSTVLHSLDVKLTTVLNSPGGGATADQIAAAIVKLLPPGVTVDALIEAMKRQWAK